jgi:hypothetical protein
LVSWQHPRRRRDRVIQPMSAFGGKADIKRTGLNVRFRPKANIATALSACLELALSRPTKTGRATRGADMSSFNIGFVIFPDVTQLDFTGPLQLLSRLPQSAIRVVAKSASPVPSDCGLGLLPTHTFANCPNSIVSRSLIIPATPSLPPGIVSKRVPQSMSRQFAQAHLF